MGKNYHYSQASLILCKNCVNQIKSEDKLAEIYKTKKVEEIKQQHHNIITINEKDIEILKNQEIIEEIKKDILNEKTISQRQIEILRNQEKANLINLYSALFIEFESDGEFDKNELRTLQNLKESLGLTHKEVNFEQKVLPYHYIYTIKNECKLPEVTLNYENDMNRASIRENEIVHFAMPAVLKEINNLDLNSLRSSSEISKKVTMGANFRVHSYNGHVKKEDKLIKISDGYLIITNERILLHPVPGNIPVSIPLNKIISYNCFENGVEIVEDGIKEGYFFKTENANAPIIIAMCLNFLCETTETRIEKMKQEILQKKIINMQQIEILKNEEKRHVRLCHFPPHSLFSNNIR